MSNQYRLVELGNSELLAGLSNLVQQSNDLTGQLLAHLVELDERKLHLELGFPSLFSYCVEALRMSEGTAGRRVTAARVCRRFPEVFERVARGELHLCALCALAPHLSSDNASDLLENCRGKTRRQVEGLLAARFPRPDVREQIRRLPARAVAAVPILPVEAVVPVGAVVPVEAIVPVEAAEHTSPSPQSTGATSAPSSDPPRLAASSKVVSQSLGANGRNSVRRARGLEPLSADRFGVHFTADAELRELIERARALASHRLPNGDLAGLMKLAVASFVQQEEKRRFGIGTKPHRTKDTDNKAIKEQLAFSSDRRTPPGGVAESSSSNEPTNDETRAPSFQDRGRYLPVQVRREAHRRDRAQCPFVSTDGRRCNARAFLEFDHVKPFARFGASDPPNIRLLCKAHNLLHARDCFGAEHLAAKIAARKLASRAD